jgi:hypothetical protein
MEPCWVRADIKRSRKSKRPSKRRKMNRNIEGKRGTAGHENNILVIDTALIVT